MDPHKLGIEISLENDAALAAARQFRDAQRNLFREMLADVERFEAASTATLRREGATRVNAARGQSQATTKAAEDAAEKVSQSLDKTATAGAAGLVRMGIASGIAQAGFNKLLDIVGAISAGIDAAQAKQAAWTSATASRADQLRELADLSGKTPGAAFALEVSRFEKQTGMRPDESVQFLTQLMNTGAQYKGRLGGEAEFQQFSRQAGALALAKGLDAGTAGDVAGGILGMSDYSKFGAQASEQATGRFNQVMTILQAGRGELGPLAKQFSQLSAASLSEDEMAGVFQKPEDIASVISVGAEANPEQSAEMARAAIRGMRDFGGKPKDLLKRAGVTPQTDFLSAIKQITPLVTQEAEQKGVKTEDVLRTYFEDQLTRSGIATYINKGVVGGLFEQRAGVAAAAEGPGPAAAAVEGFRATPVGRLRLGEADTRLAEQEQGARDEQLNILREQAKARMVRRGDLTSTTGAMHDYLLGKIPVNMLGSGEQLRLDEEGQRILQERAEPKGVTLGRGMRDWLNFTPESRAEDLRNQMRQLKAAGVDPLGEREALIAAMPDRAPRGLPEAAEAPDPGDPLRLGAVNRARRAAGLGEVGGGGGMTEKTGQEMVGELKKLNDKVGPRGPEPAPRVPLGAPAAPRR